MSYHVIIYVKFCPACCAVNQSEIKSEFENKTWHRITVDSHFNEKLYQIHSGQS